MAYKGYINKDVQAMYDIPYSQLTAEQKRILHEDSKRRAKLIEETQQQVMKNNLKAYEDEAKLEKVLGKIYRDCQKQILASVSETIAKVEKAGGTWSYANQSALTRSRGLFEQITAELNKLGQKEQAVFTQGLSNIYTDQFLRQVYTLGQSIPVKANFNRLNPALVKRTLDYPWSGAMFSDRIWQDKEKLGRNLREGLTQSMILGEGIPEITERINKNIGTAQYNAERVARTETKRVTYVAHNDVYEDTGVEKIKYYTSGMKSASEVCGTCKKDNGKPFDRGKEPTLPRHPNCKCVYVPVVDDTFKMGELNELTHSVRGAENYEKWINANKDKINPDGSLKDGWVRDWKNGGNLVNKNASLKTEEKTDKDNVAVNISPVTEKAIERNYEEAYNKFMKEVNEVRSSVAVARVTRDYLKAVGSKIQSAHFDKVEAKVAKAMATQLVELDRRWNSTLKWFSTTSDGIPYGVSGLCTPYEDIWEETGNDADLYSRIKVNSDYYFSAKKAYNGWKDNQKYPNTVKVDEEHYMISTLTHEYGHSILGGKISEALGTNAEVFEKAKRINRKYKSQCSALRVKQQRIMDKYAGNENFYDLLNADKEYVNAIEQYEKLHISRYADTSIGEFIAEAFCQAELSSTPSPYAVELHSLLKEYFGK